MILMIENAPVRFTDDGKLFIVDAISALVQQDGAQAVWETIKTKKPEIEKYVAVHTLSDKETVQVTDATGWDHIQDYLFDHLVEQSTRI